MNFLFAASLVLASASGPALTSALTSATAPVPALVPALQLSSEPDTTRRIGAVDLGEVRVRPGQEGVLRSGPKKGPNMARRMLPGQSIAVELLPTAGQSYQLNTVRFFLNEVPKQGRLRLLLVAPVIDSKGDHSPGTTNLLPRAIVITQQQLREAHRGRVAVDVSKYNLVLPAEGVYVVIDALATDPNDLPVAVSRSAGRRGGLTMIVASNPEDLSTAHTYPADDFPAVAGMRGEGAATWSRSSKKPVWERGGSTSVRVELGVVVN